MTAITEVLSQTITTVLRDVLATEAGHTSWSEFGFHIRLHRKRPLIVCPHLQSTACYEHACQNTNTGDLFYKFNAKCTSNRQQRGARFWCSGQK